MYKVLKAILLLLLFNSFAYSQDDITTNYDNYVLINKIEYFVLTNQIDSISGYTSKAKKTPYLNLLERIISGKKVTYLEYYNFIKKISSRIDLDYSKVSDFINNQIIEPTDETHIDLNYVKIKWLQISKLRDEVTIESASKEQNKLEDYIANFDKNEIDVRKALLYASTHEIVLYTIENDLENGKKLCLENLEEAKLLNDKELIIASLYHLCDFLILEGKLTEYINTCEKGLAIEATLKEKSPYYVGTIIHALDAYIYKGGDNKRVEELLGLLDNDINTKPLIYSLYAKYLGNLDLESTSAKNIFNQLEVSNLKEFSTKVESLGSQVLNPNDFYHLLNEISIMLQKHNYLNEALDYKTKSVLQTRKIYSEDLANSLANEKAKQAINQKDLEIKHEKERTNLYLIIAILIAVLFIITIFTLVKTQKQSAILKDKNTLIKKTLKEKELLIKEVHHRVKNNFQIISSLLEIQNQGVEDKKALEMVKQSRNRIKSMAIIHQKLYQNEDGLIDFKDYIQILVNELSTIYVSNKNIETNIEMDNLYFDIDTAIPLGLIINELLTNAYKHAFKEKVIGKLDIKIKSQGKDTHVLTFSDNGSGFLKKIDINKIKSLGLRLVSRLTKQLQGELTIKSDKGGSTIEVIFMSLQARKRIL